MSTVALSESSCRRRAAGSGQETAILSRLHKAHGQRAGVTSMREGGRHCFDVLDQLSAVTAADHAVGVLVLTDHINACARVAIESGDSDEQVAELTTTVRRYVRRRRGRHA